MSATGPHRERDAEDPMASNAGGRHAVTGRRSGPGGGDTDPAVKVAQISNPQAGMACCARCQARWGGLRTAHCDACHETFTVVAAFDKHRAGSHTDGGRHCIDPATVGLVDVGRAYCCWGFPGRDEDEAAS
jgi:hypothetical protein